MLTRSMAFARGIRGIPFDVLCHIVQLCCDGNIYKLCILRAVSRSFQAAVATVSSSLKIADMRYNYSSGITYPPGGDDIVKGVLVRCRNLVGLLLISRQDYYVGSIQKLLSYLPNTLCILQMHHCHMSSEVLREIGRALPHLQGLSLNVSNIDKGSCSAWEGFPQLKLLRVDWMRGVTWKSILPLRSQLVYLACHGCMHMDDGICKGLESCIALDLGHNNISDAGLQALLDEGAPKLKLLLLNAKSGNLWEDGSWTPAMVERMQERGIKVIQSAGYGTNKPAVKECLQEVLHDSPDLLKYGAKYVI